MARIKHIALTTKEPAKVAEFYKSAFGLKELRRSPNGAVFLTDGHINVAILNTKGEDSPDMGAHGPHFTGVHHFGFEVDDLDEACTKLEGAHGERLTAKARGQLIWARMARVSAASTISASRSTILPRPAPSWRTRAARG